MHRTHTRGRIALAALLLLLVPAVALAHQFLRSSTPAAGEEVTAVPDTLRLDFSETVRLDFTRVTLEGPYGRIALGSPALGEDDPRALLVPVEGPWTPGAFTLEWRTVGADGHRTDGTVEFTVAEDADGLPDPDAEEVEEDTVLLPPPPVDPTAVERPELLPEDPVYAAVRWVTFAAIVTIIGAAGLPLVVLPVMRQRRAEEEAWIRAGVHRGAALVGLAAAGALLFAALLRLWAQSASIFGVHAALDPASLSGTLGFQPWGAGWALQTGAAVLAAAGFVLVRRSVAAGWWLAGVAVIAAALTPALSGHAAAATSRSVAIVADFLHVVSAGGWVGGLFILIVAGLPAAARLEAGRRGRAVSALVHAFSPVALVLAGVLISTGLLMAWLHAGDFAVLWTTEYGRTLLLKLLLFSGVFALGAYNFLRVRPALGADAGTRRLRRSATVELALAVAVLVVTAVLVAVPPPAS